MKIMLQNQRIGFLFISVVGLLLHGCTPGADHSKRTADLDEFLARELPSHEPGGAILIMKKEKTIFSKGYGIADIATKEAITSQTLFNIGSISKTFVANAILMLQERGKLSVEDNLLKYFPEFKNKDIAQKVRIKHLLTHTSGLPDIREVSKDTLYYLTAKDAGNWYPVTQADSLLFEPGSQFEYSNPAFNGLALIVEDVSKTKWQAFIEQNIMRPSGMETSTVTDGPHPQSGVSHGYVKNHGKWTEDDYGEEPTFPASGNGGVWSSVEELARYELALQNAIFLKPETVKGSRTVKTFDNSTGNARATDWSWFKPAIGWSWFIDQTTDSLQTIGHTGSQGGFVANYVTIPKKEVFFVILCNAPHDTRKITERIMTWLSDNRWLEEK